MRSGCVGRRRQPGTGEAHWIIGYRDRRHPQNFTDRKDPQGRLIRPRVSLLTGWRIRLLPGAHAAVDQQHLSVDMLGGVAEQEHGGFAGDVWGRHLSVGRVPFHPAADAGLPQRGGGQRRFKEPGASPLTRIPRGANSTHKLRTSISTAPLEASYAT